MWASHSSYMRCDERERERDCKNTVRVKWDRDRDREYVYIPNLRLFCRQGQSLPYFSLHFGRS